MSRVSPNSVKSTVLDYLSKYPHLRDSDEKLIANIWYQEAKKYDPTLKLSELRSFLKIVSEGILSNPESIRRCRQILQSQEPALRGDNYEKRKANQSKVKKEVRTNGATRPSQKKINYGS